MTIGICSGYFALGCHAGHLDLIYGALTKCDEIYIIINNNKQTEKKYGFIPLLDTERQEIIDRLHGLDNKIINGYISQDEDESVAKTIEHIVYLLKGLAKVHNQEVPIFTFYNGGDRGEVNANSKEVEVCQRLGIEIVYLDQPKVASTSEIINRIKKQGVNEYLLSEIQKSLFLNAPIVLNSEVPSGKLPPNMIDLAQGRNYHICDPMGCVHDEFWRK